MTCGNPQPGSKICQHFNWQPWISMVARNVSQELESMFSILSQPGPQTLQVGKMFSGFMGLRDLGRVHSQPRWPAFSIKLIDWVHLYSLIKMLLNEAILPLWYGPWHINWVLLTVKLEMWCPP